MSRYILPGMLGLLVGLLLNWAGFSRQEGLRRALGLRRSLPLRSGLTAVGWAMAVTALLCWLAVIDVDTIVVLPLSAGALLGGAALGIAAGLCGFTPSTAFAGLGAGRALEALSTLAGCAVMTLLLPRLDGVIAPLRQAAPYSAATLFQVTLDEPFLLGGGFLGQGCAGLLLVAIALCVPSPRPVILPDDTLPAPVPPASPETFDLPDSTAPEADPSPEDAAEDTFVALLPGEEPLVVDTELDDEADGEPSSDEEEASPAEEAGEPSDRPDGDPPAEKV